MQIKEVRLQPEAEGHYRQVEELIREAFWNYHTPGCCEHYLAHILRGCDAFLRELDMVAVQGGVVLGSIMYTKAAVKLDVGGELPVLTFGPLAVRPDCQSQGVGGALIRHTTALARVLGHRAILIYGDPEYYGRFGFVPAEQFGIGTHEDKYAAALQALELVPGALKEAEGRFFESPIFQVEEAAAREYDRHFEPKQKKSGLGTQLRFEQLVRQQKPREREIKL